MAYAQTSHLFNDILAQNNLGPTAPEIYLETRNTLRIVKLTSCSRIGHLNMKSSGFKAHASARRPMRGLRSY